MNHTPAVDRPLDALETTVWLLDRRARMNVAMVAEVRGPLNGESLRTALDALQQRHPLLRVRVAVGDDGRLAFRSADVPPLPLRVVEGPAEAWRPEAEREQHEGFPAEGGPLGRCVWLRHAPEKSTILVVFHHMIGDGLSGVFLTRDLLTAAGEACSGRRPRLEPLAPIHPLRSSLPSSERGAAGLWNDLAWLGREFIAHMAHGFPRAPRSDAEVPLKDRRTRLVPRRLDKEATRAVAQRARQEGTTVHGALSAAQLLAVAEEFHAGRRVPLILGSAVNLRAQTRPPVGDDLGFFVSWAAATHRVGPRTDFWDLARAVRSDLTKRLKRGEPWAAIAGGTRGLAWLGRWAVISEEMAGWLTGGTEIAGRRLNGLTNLGELAVPERYGSLTLEALHFAAAMSGLCNLGSSSATFAGRLHWNFMYQHPVFAAERVERLADRAMRQLTRAVAWRDT